MIRGPVSEHIAHDYHWQVAGLEYASLEQPVHTPECVDSWLEL